MARFGMIIDLGKCYGCDACAMACRDAHLVPPDISLLDVKKSSAAAGETGRLTAPVFCMHCDSPACRDACAFDALTLDRDGVVVVNDEACTGCAACVEACPYGALVRSTSSSFALPDGFMTDEQKRVTAVWMNRVTNKTPAKCDLCAGRRAVGRPPACVAACPVEAYCYGDFDDPDSNVSRIAASGIASAVVVKGASPRIFYIIPENMDPQSVRLLVLSYC